MSVGDTYTRCSGPGGDRGAVPDLDFRCGEPGLLDAGVDRRVDWTPISTVTL